MQPVVHLAVGYVCYAIYTRRRCDASPRDGPAIAAILGAALPDLLDKPIWLVGIVDVGRTIGHSLLFALPLLVALGLYARSSDREVLAVAFAVGYLSHVATDVPWHVLSGDVHELGFLLWPITPMPPYSGTKPLATVPGLEVTVTTLWLEAVVLVAGIGRWWVDGKPGLEAVSRALSG
ncbi:LexA-binding, inner membrane-associated putative hydrolase [Halobiforma haloterrestris]|uniref:LexA-binding, inner membrane-associated putative hydrolase n=1 Tax=Natronobacterium haloterrestre TaxID=148448 RepID=A0A1I1GQ32_NATHA|nr:metal-dependent hydrolase [Halobiforma haloterrestris]SFC11180.1 LexA-binding, inner membrane-associated putative hydrolase [Halobiforma haloterrestris]